MRFRQMIMCIILKQENVLSVIGGIYETIRMSTTITEI